ncbi:EamA-like protein, partial [Euroglyphus maynei]
MDQPQPTKIYKAYNRQNSFNIPQFIQSHHQSDELMASISRNNNKMNHLPTIGQTVINHEPFTDKLNRKIPLFGLIMSMLSVVCFSLASLIVKILTEYHALEILGIRSVFQVIFYLSTTLYLRLPVLGLPGHRLDCALRAIFGSIAAITIYMSYRLIPLADASTIQFSAPVLVFVLAYFILSEPMTCCHILIGFVAFIGVVFVSKPKFILQYFDPSILEKVNYQGIILAI